MGHQHGLGAAKLLEGQGEDQKRCYLQPSPRWEGVTRRCFLTALEETGFISEPCLVVFIAISMLREMQPPRQHFMTFRPK